MVLVTVLPPFYYAPLDLASDGIRLLRLIRGEPADPIECQILETCLRDTNRMPYEALSYCWGSNKLTSAVILDGCHKPVTDNLLIALKHLRRHDTDRILWIDAICINQDNKKEQGHQVAQMKRIYENADRVVVWLGEGGKETDMLMDVMAVLEKNPAKLDAMMRGESSRGGVLRFIYRAYFTDSSAALGYQYHDSKEKMVSSTLSFTLHRLLDRPWFKRIWVVQEVACAKSMVFVCGSRDISGVPFSDLASLLRILANNQAIAILDVLPGRRERNSWWTENRELGTLLTKFQQSEATDERDKVYALLGISSDASLGNALPPDYEKPMEKVVQSTMSFILFGEQVDLDAYPLPRWTLDQVIQGQTERNPSQVFCNVLSWAVMNRAISTAELLLKPTARRIAFRSPFEYYHYLLSASSAQNRRLVAALLSFEPANRKTFDTLIVKLSEGDGVACFQLLCSYIPVSASHGPIMARVVCFPIFEGQSALVIDQAQQQTQQSEGWKEPGQQKLNSFLCGLLQMRFPSMANPDLIQCLVRQGADPGMTIDGLGR